MNYDEELSILKNIITPELLKQSCNFHINQNGVLVESVQISYALAYANRGGLRYETKNFSLTIVFFEHPEILMLNMKTEDRSVYYTSEDLHTKYEGVTNNRNIITKEFLNNYENNEEYSFQMKTLYSNYDTMVFVSKIDEYFKSGWGSNDRI